jgi:hypothetical protein
MRETIPDRLTLAVFIPGALHLVSRGGSPPPKVLWERDRLARGRTREKKWQCAVKGSSARKPKGRTQEVTSGQEGLSDYHGLMVRISVFATIAIWRMKMSNLQTRTGL